MISPERYYIKSVDLYYYIVNEQYEYNICNIDFKWWIEKNVNVNFARVKTVAQIESLQKCKLNVAISTHNFMKYKIKTSK